MKQVVIIFFAFIFCQMNVYSQSGISYITISSPGPRDQILFPIHISTDSNFLDASSLNSDSTLMLVKSLTEVIISKEDYEYLKGYLVKNSIKYDTLQLKEIEIRSRSIVISETDGNRLRKIYFAEYQEGGIQFLQNLIVHLDRSNSNNNFTILIERLEEFIGGL